MRENRTYGLTRGRSGEAASLYSTVLFFSSVIIKCRYCNVFEKIQDNSRFNRCRGSVSRFQTYEMYPRITTFLIL